MTPWPEAWKVKRIDQTCGHATAYRRGTNVCRELVGLRAPVCIRDHALAPRHGLDMVIARLVALVDLRGTRGVIVELELRRGTRDHRTGAGDHFGISGA